MSNIISALKRADVGKIKENEPLSRHTTIKTGGPAAVFVNPENIVALQDTIRIARQFEQPWCVIGRGSNLLVNDQGLEGVTINIGRGLSSLAIDDDEVTVGAGHSFVALSAILSKKGLSGLEFAGGIPGSVGGAVYMNAGAHGSDMSHILKAAQILYPDGSIKWLSHEDMAYRYRTSILQKNGGICITAVLKMKKGDSQQIFAEMKRHKNYRRETQPFNRCCGSVFRNPLPEHAGHLIESSGLKGYRMGDAQISELHGNFIMNNGQARAADVRALIDHIKHHIARKYGIQLQTEVEFMDRDYDNHLD